MGVRPAGFLCHESISRRNLLAVIRRLHRRPRADGDHDAGTDSCLPDALSNANPSPAANRYGPGLPLLAGPGDR